LNHLGIGRALPADSQPRGRPRHKFGNASEDENVNALPELTYDMVRIALQWSLQLLS
jgi:hypothetical protein